ncbi:MAG: AAA family ATPase [Planctomycetota bacterium]
MSESRRAALEALRKMLESDPSNVPLWIHCAELWSELGEPGEAISALRMALDIEPGSQSAIRTLIRLLRENGRLAEALIRAERSLEAGDDLEIRTELARIHLARGDIAEARSQIDRLRAEGGDVTELTEALETAAEQAPAAHRGPVPSAEDPDASRLAAIDDEARDLDSWAEQFDWGDLRITFEDVVGLDSVKEQIRLRIIAPFQNPEIYRAFAKQAGGGMLLYGPPGCGKTFIARATAGECRARFLSVGIAEIVDKYWGESEKMVHALFEEARRNTPTILFFDEFDALGSARGRSGSQFWRTLVDQLLQEMDGLNGRNEEILVFAATNEPWSVDGAFRRPGRFDRVLFVPPPDEPARAEIVRRRLTKLPGGERIDPASIASRTRLMTGADLIELCDRASERALSRSLETGEVHPVEPADFDRVLGSMEISSASWLATARNFARYSNEGGQYDQLVRFLKQVKKW